MRRDLALPIDTGGTFAQIEETVKKAEGKLGVCRCSTSTKEEPPAGKKSYGIAITLQDDEDPPNDRQIDAVMQKVITSPANSSRTKREHRQNL